MQYKGKVYGKIAGKYIPVEVDSITELAQRNYDAVVKRGLINGNTTNQDFLDKLFEEAGELEFEVDRFNKVNIRLELGDVIVTALNMATHLNINIEQLLTEIAIKNEGRAV